MDISIIIPVYNAEKFIEKCLDSILKQEDNQLIFEIIAVNDGSTDDSLKVLNHYPKLFSNITIIDSVNKGAGSARNIGIAKASGNYIWFIDADDFISEKSFKNLESNIKECISDLIIFDYNVVGTDSLREVKSSFPDNIITLSNYFENAQALFLWKHLYKSELILNKNLKFIEGIKNIEDFEFNVRFFHNAHSISYVHGSFYNYFYNASSTSRNISKKNLEKLASDSHIVHLSLQKMLVEQGINNQIVNDLVNKSIIGFFFSLFKFGYTFKEVKMYYETYVKEDLLPAKIVKKNSKFRLFMFIVNSKFLYQNLVFFKKKIFFS